MIIDTSALLAIFFDEPEAQIYDQAIGLDRNSKMSVANFLEAAMVVEGRSDDNGDELGDELDDLVDRLGIQFVPVTIDHVKIARQAWRDYGKGNHTAALNYGDCFAYALARTTGEPLLFKGNDFAQTNIPPAQTAP